MKIIVIQKEPLETIPPLISTLIVLNKLGYDVKLITCGITDYWRSQLKSMKIEYDILPYLNRRKFIIPFTDKIIKYLEYKTFKVKVNNILRYCDEKKTVLWIEGAPAILALGTSIKRFKYILQIMELHNTERQKFNAIGKVIKEAKLVFIPEYNRCTLYQVWFKLKNKPILLPNKPYFWPKDEDLDLMRVKYKDILMKIGNKKIILYQGIFNKDRDLTFIVTAVQKLNKVNDDFLLMLLGQDNAGLIKSYVKIDTNIIHIDYIPAPYYLYFTKLCYIGIAIYSPFKLNTTYCAPNKIYEYGYFGKPIIGNNIPGLKYTIEKFNSGVLYNSNDENEIIDCILDIDRNYKTYSTSARKMFDECDNEKTILNALNSVSLF